MRAILQEMRRAASQLRHSPGFTAVTTGILALGLAVTLYMFAVVKAYMLTSLPFPEAGRIMHLERAHLRQPDETFEVSQHDFVDWRAAQTSFEDLAAFYVGTVNLSGGDLPERYEGAFITPSAFGVTAEPALIGRTLLPEDASPGAAPVVVLGYDVWQNRYNGDRRILSKTVRVNGVPSAIVGVMPRGFQFPLAQEVWVPLKIDLADVARGDGITLEVFGRLKAGVSPAQARAEFSNIAATLAERYEKNKNVTAVIKPFQDEYVPEEARQVLRAMFGAVILVLLIACANVANLILARTAARQQDIALRAALGASRWRILVHVLTESVLLSAAGAVVGWFLAGAGLDLTARSLRAAGIEEPFWIRFELDGRVLAFAVLAAVVSGLIAGLAPALRASRTDVNNYLKDGGKGSGSTARLSRTLVTGEIALSCILLVSASLMIQSIVNLGTRPLGIEHTDDVLTGRIGLPEAQYGDPAAQFRFFEALDGRLNSDPGVAGATAASSYPGMNAAVTPYRLRGGEAREDERTPLANYAGVLNDYARVLGMKVLEGRWFDARERADSEAVAVIDRHFAELAFPDGDAIGRQVLFGDPDGEDSRWRTIIGISESTTLEAIDDPERPSAFFPLVQAPSRFLTVAVRTRGDPLAYSQRLREIVRQIDADIPVYWVRTLDTWILAGNFTSRIVSALFGIFALIAVALAAAGIYSVLAYSVSQRTREIGVRRAVGALDGRILELILRQGALQLGVGLAVGLVVAIGFARLLSSLLRGVAPFDPPTLLGVASILCVIALLASLLPALRAVRVSPMDALRHE